MDIAKHIEILLLTNDCVIVPGLGGFMTHYLPAHYDVADGTFLPPQRTLGFNPQLTMNDSLLAQSYVEAYDISYPDAVSKIESEVLQLRDHLDKNGQYELQGLGVLSLNNEGHIVFEPCEAGVLTPEYYGLGSFHMNLLLNAERKSPKASSSVFTRRVYAVRNRRALNTLRNLAAAAIIITAFLFIPSPADRGNKVPKQITESAVLGNIIPKHIEIKANDTKLNTSVHKPAPAPVVKEEPKAAEPVKPFTIVLASRITRSNGENLVESLKQDGVEDVRLYTRKSGVRVVKGAYATREEAQEHLNRLCSDERFADAWVLKIKQD